jgi:hypothetical protein
MPRAGFVSCDIVGHSAAKDLEVQRRRLEGLNAVVRRALQQCGPGGAVWSSGGDGGHLAFCRDEWPGLAEQFLIELLDWARAEGVALRGIGHCGETDQIEGADGQVELIGHGINLAGRLLAQAFPQGVLVTAPFKAALEEAGVTGLLTHDPRVLRPKYFPAQVVYLLSVPGRFSSRWDRPAGGDRELLEEALAEGQAWRVLLLAKRLLQTNSVDGQAEDALDQLGAHSLVYHQQVVGAEGRTQVRPIPNPFLGGLEPGALRQVVRVGQLVERQHGEVLCRVGDEGDSMFIVLDGVIGGFVPHSQSEELSTDADLVFGPGEIIGELAFTLQRPRTATLVALDDASMLAVHATELATQARSNPRLAAGMEKFLTGRTLAYVCDSVPYLVGRDQSGPLAEAGRERAWNRLLAHAEKIICPLADPRPINLEDPRFAGEGLYILVCGRLKSLAHPDKILSGFDLPLVYVDLPGWACSPNHHYRPEAGDVVLLRLDKEAFLGPRPVIDAVMARLMPELPRLYHHDVFLSYTFDDQVVARRWRAALEAAGLRVYMEVSTSGHYFRDRIEAGILDSLTMLALVSANTMVRPPEQNWVGREITFRKAAFETTTARILPVRLNGGWPEVLADGYTIIEAVHREEAAIAEAVEAIRRIRQGAEPAPYSRSRKVNVRLES